MPSVDPIAASSVAGELFFQQSGTSASGTLGVGGGFLPISFNTGLPVINGSEVRSGNTVDITPNDTPQAGTLSLGSGITIITGVVLPAAVISGSTATVTTGVSLVAATVVRNNTTITVTPD